MFDQLTEPYELSGAEVVLQRKVRELLPQKEDGHQEAKAKADYSKNGPCTQEQVI